MLRLLFSLTIIILAGFTAPLQAAKFRALLVGINYEHADTNITRLQGALNDVEAVYALLTGPLQVPAAAIHRLTEAQATKAGIIKEIQDWLITGTGPGDTVFFMFAGHGTTVLDQSGTQRYDPDKFNDNLQQAEALVPYDAGIDESTESTENLLLDSELNKLLTQLHDRKVTLWLDACHSGGATRSFSLQFRPRVLNLPWMQGDTTSNTEQTATPRGLARIREKAKLPYSYFAAARHFQSAREFRGRGMFTRALTTLLTANPTARYTNEQIIRATRDFMQNSLHMPTATQEPVFYGPDTALQATFPLLSARDLDYEQPANVTPPAYIPTSATTVTRVELRGEGALADDLRTELSHQQTLRLDSQQPDLIVEVTANTVDLYHPAGQLLQQLPLATATVINAILGYRTGQQLGNIHNIAAPFQVELWLEKPGKTTFDRDARPTLYYRVAKLPYKQAYLTLLNLAPDGSVAVLYPQPKRTAKVGKRRLFLNAPVIPGRIHSIPRGQDALQPGDLSGEDLVINLNQLGTEYFKAIVTPEPLDLNAMDAQLMATGLKAAAGSGFAARLNSSIDAMAATLSASGWGTGNLRITVK